MSKIDANSVLEKINEYLEEINRLLTLRSDQGGELKDRLNFKIRMLIRTAWPQSEPQLIEYDSMVNSIITIPAEFDEEEEKQYAYESRLKIMKKHLQLYKEEIGVQLSMEHVTKIHPSVQVTQCASSDRSFEVHLTGTGFPPDTNTVTQVIFPGGSSPGSIPFRTDNLGNLRSFFSYSVEPSNIPPDRYIVNVFVGDSHEKADGVPEAWADFKLPFQNESSLTLDNIPDVPCAQSFTISGRLSARLWSPMASRVFALKEITFTGTGAMPEKAMTNEEGRFVTSLVSPNDANSRMHVQAHFAGDCHFKNSESNVVYYNTRKRTCSLNLVVEPSMIQNNENFEVIAILNDTISRSPLKSRTLIFGTDPPIEIAKGTTSSDGVYKSMALAAPRDSGSYFIQAHFPGDDMYEMAYSEKKILRVEISIEHQLIKGLKECPRGRPSARKYEIVYRKYWITFSLHLYQKLNHRVKPKTNLKNAI